ncbi:MAG: hypothetical protein KF860_13610 [Cyclobacteriaceae bacterium]|nr:hypothetical protein [Cyclobacteriaceae bacterium]
MYRPVVEALTVECLAQRVLELRSLNELVMKVELRLRQLYKQRKAVTCEGQERLVNTGRAVKNYIRAVFGFRSDELINVSLTKRYQ